MKKICIAAVFFTVIGCAPVAIAKPVLIPTTTPFIVPSLANETPAPTRTPIIVSPTPQDLSYVVQPNDTLKGIAEQFGVSVMYLADLNGINNPNKIQVGEVLSVSGDVQYPAAPVGTGKVILAILGKQRVYAFEDGVFLKEFLVSTGRASHETVTGTFRVQAKYVMAHMVGSDYDVMSPWTQYFGNDVISWHDGYSFHGAPWNHDLGTPHSHGCLNMYVDDAKWLFDWTEPVSTGGITISPDLNTGTLIVIRQ